MQQQQQQRSWHPQGASPGAASSPEELPLPEASAQPPPSLLALVNDADFVECVLPLHFEVDERPVFLQHPPDLYQRLYKHFNVQSPSPPAHPPPAHHETLGRPLPAATHLAVHTNPRKHKKLFARWQLLCGAIAATSILLLLLATIFAFVILGFSSSSSSSSILFSDSNGAASAEAIKSLPSKSVQPEISPNHLLTLLITNRNVCVFEAASDDEEASVSAFVSEHIETAKLLFYSNLSHSGVPVHPLQFQRIARGLGVDSDCHVVVYDRGQVIWSTYATWLFELYGHSKVSILSGGFDAWKALQSHSSQYKTESGRSTNKHQGDLVAGWNSSIVVIYDDVLLNAETGRFDLIDAQTTKEFTGEADGALFGHIRGAISVPIESVYDWSQARWPTPSAQTEAFVQTGLSPTRPIIVYCSTSVRASMVWWALRRVGFHARLYFGGWPEWLVRAPDYLKVLPS